MVCIGSRRRNTANNNERESVRERRIRWERERGVVQLLLCSQRCCCKVQPVPFRCERNKTSPLLYDGCDYRHKIFVEKSNSHIMYARQQVLGNAWQSKVRRSKSDVELHYELQLPFCVFSCFDVWLRYISYCPSSELSNKSAIEFIKGGAWIDFCLAHITLVRITSLDVAEHIDIRFTLGFTLGITI